MRLSVAGVEAIHQSEAAKAKSELRLARAEQREAAHLAAKAKATAKKVQEQETAELGEGGHA